MVAEARSQSSAQDIVTTGVMRHLAAELLAADDGPGLEVVAAMTDHELMALLLTHPRTGRTAEVLRRDPTSWSAHPAGPSTARHDELELVLSRLHLELPLVDGEPMAGGPALLAGLPATPARYLIRPRHPEPVPR